MECLVVIHHHDISALANMAAHRGTQSVSEIGGSSLLGTIHQYKKGWGRGLLGFILQQWAAAGFPLKLSQESSTMYFLFSFQVSKIIYLRHLGITRRPLKQMKFTLVFRQDDQILLER